MKIVLSILVLLVPFAIAYGQSSDFLTKFDSATSLTSASEMLLDAAVASGKVAVKPVLATEGSTIFIDDWAKGVKDMRRGAEVTNSYQDLRKKIRFEEIQLDQIKKTSESAVFESAIKSHYSHFGADEPKKLLDYIRGSSDVSVVKITIFNAQDVEMGFFYLFWKKQEGKWRLQQAAAHLI